jgi:hypothetical protein
VSTLLITNCGLFTSQELPEYLRQLIIRVVLQLLCVFCQLTCNDPVEFDYQNTTKSIKLGIKIILIHLTSIINFNYSIPFSIVHNTTE